MSKVTTQIIDSVLTQDAYPLGLHLGFKKTAGRRLVREQDVGCWQTITYDVVNYRTSGCSSVGTTLSVGFKAVQELLCEALAWDCDAQIPIQVSSDTGHIVGGDYGTLRVRVGGTQDIPAVSDKISTEMRDVVEPWFASLCSLADLKRYILQHPLGVHATCVLCIVELMEGDTTSALARAAAKLSTAEQRLQKRGQPQVPRDVLDLRRLTAWIEEREHRASFPPV